MHDSAELVVEGVCSGVLQDEENAPKTILINSRHSHGDKERSAFKTLYQTRQFNITPQPTGFAVSID